MKTSTIPLISGIALAAMIAAGTSHWWSVRQFMVAMEPGAPVSIHPQSAPPVQLPAIAKSPKTPETPARATPAAVPHQKDFYEALIQKMASVETQNRDLLDQLAETNRDLMKLEFRVDTHSESFRPLPVSEEQPFTSLSEDPGVLPPRAEPVMLPSPE